MHYIRTCSEVISEGADVWLGQCGSQTVIRSAWYIIGYEGYIISVWHQVVYRTIKRMDMPSIASIVSIGRFYMGVNHYLYRNDNSLLHCKTILIKNCTEETRSMFNFATHGSKT